MLAALQGKTHEVVTAICLLCLRQHRQRIFTETTAVRFRQLEDPEIHNYVKNVNPLDKAGAYAIQEHGEWIIERIEGSYSNVVGLPVEKLGQELDQWFNRPPLSTLPFLQSTTDPGLSEPAGPPP